METVRDDDWWEIEFMGSTKSSSKPITVTHDEDGPPVVLIPENNDVFVRTGKQVIEACRLSISIDVWLEELKSMFNAVNAWAAARNDIAACYCAPRGARIALFFIPVGDRFNFGLASELAELNTELLTKFNIGMVEIRQIPGVEVNRFLDVSRSHLIYDRTRKAHPAVDA